MAAWICPNFVIGVAAFGMMTPIVDALLLGSAHGTSAQAYAKAVDDLWDGIDVALPEKEARHRSAASPFINSTGKSRVRNEHKRLEGIQILGMFDTGTNLITHTLQKNFGDERFKQLCPINGDGSGHCFFKKHLSPPNLTAALDKLDRDILIVAMVRSPLASIAAWKKAPYGLDICINSTNFLDDQATFCKPQQKYGPGYKGITGIWNTFTEKYHRLGAEYPRHKTIIVEYERLVLEPERVVEDIASALGEQLISASVQTLTAPAKEHGAAVGRAKAIEKLTTMSYLHSSPIDDAGVRQALCSHLDASLINRHVVPLKPVPRTYAADCERTIA